MGDYTGQVVQNNEGEWRFANDEDNANNLQRLSRTTKREDEIDLKPYANKYCTRAVGARLDVQFENPQKF